MKISAKLVLLAGALVVAYPASSWLLGRQIEKVANELHSQVEETQAIARVVERRYQRGVFSSTETVTLEVSGDLLSAGEADTPSLRITFLTNYQHGPLVDGATLGAAVSNTELILDAELRKRFSDVAGQQQLFVARTLHRFDGGGTSTMSVPPFSFELPVENGSTPGLMSSDGASLVLDFQPGLAAYSYRGNMPKIEVTSGGGRAAISALGFSGDVQRVFADEALLYTGVEKYSLGQMSFSDGTESGNEVVIEQVVLDAEMPVNGDFMDVVAKLSAQSLRVGAQDHGPAHYDFSLRHLHARTVAGMYRAMRDMQASQDVAADPTLLLAPLAAAGQELLKYQPEFRIERISFNSPQGEARLSGSARLGDVSEEALASPAMLMEKLEADADIAVPEALLKALAAGDHEAGAANMADDQVAVMVEQQLTALAEQGYITRKQGMISSKMMLSGGELTVNGKPFSPMIGTSPAPVSEINPEGRTYRD